MRQERRMEECARCSSREPPVLSDHIWWRLCCGAAAWFGPSTISARAKRGGFTLRRSYSMLDIRKPETIDKAFRRVDCVLHLAALPVPLSIANPLETHMVNVVGTINVLSAARNWLVR